MAYLASGPQWQPPPPVDPAAADRVYRWFKVYVALMALICATVVAVAFLVAVFGVDASATDATEQRVFATMYGVAALIPLGVHAVGLFLPRKPWEWGLRHRAPQPRPHQLLPVARNHPAPDRVAEAGDEGALQPVLSSGGLRVVGAVCP